MDDTVFFGQEPGEGNLRHRPSLNSQAIRDAKAVCATCPVSRECLEYALDHEETFGVWGGMTARERARLVDDDVR